MEAEIHKNETGHWEMPLPFRQKEVRMPNNYAQASSRLKGLLHTLNKKPQMQRDYFAFMEKIFERGHASPVPREDTREKAILDRCGTSHTLEFTILRNQRK